MRVGETPRKIHVEILNGHRLPGGVAGPACRRWPPAIANALRAHRAAHWKLPLLRPAAV